MNTTYNPMSLVGKTILVTGASSGIGQAIAIECSKLGAIVICTARNEERLKQTISMMEGEGHSYVVADLVDEDALTNLVERIPKLDGVSHNAGISVMMLCAFIKNDAMNKLFEFNALSAVRLQTMLFKKKKINRGGSIVFMSSTAAFKGTLGNAVYGMTKAALASYAKYIAGEMGGKGIRANSVHPAMVVTPLLEGEKLSKEDYLKDAKKYPLQRYGQPEEIAHMVAYLLSEAASWVSGAQFVIDGGLSVK